MIIMHKPTLPNTKPNPMTIKFTHEISTYVVSHILACMMYAYFPTCATKHRGNKSRHVLNRQTTYKLILFLFSTRIQTWNTNYKFDL